MPSQIFPIQKRDQKILVIGDVILDEYIYGHARKLAHEGPIPAMEQYSVEKEVGAAGNVYLNLKYAGADADLVAACFGDEAGRCIVQQLKALTGKGELKAEAATGRTPWKKRYVCDGQLLLRLDSPASTTELPRKEREAIREEVAWGVLQEPDCIVISDYGKGTITWGLLQLIPPDLCPVVIDPYPTTRGYPPFKVRVFTPNHNEYNRMKFSGSPCFITNGPFGLDLMENGGVSYHVPAITSHPQMVTGAGDVVTAWVALGLCEGLSMVKIAEIANLAAGRAVRKRGNCTVTREEVEDAYRERAEPD